MKSSDPSTFLASVCSVKSHQAEGREREGGYSCPRCHQGRPAPQWKVLRNMPCALREGGLDADTEATRVQRAVPLSSLHFLFTISWVHPTPSQYLMTASNVQELH